MANILSNSLTSAMSSEYCTYDYLQQNLLQAQSLTGAAEAHGILCGLLCVSGNHGQRLWTEHLLHDCNADTFIECERALQDFFDAAQAQLNADSLHFMPLVPDDEDTLEERLTALGNWCGGLLFGLGLGSTRSTDTLTPQIQEFIQDVIAISHIAPEEPQADDEEDAERHYMQLLEYLKIGTLTLYEESSLLSLPQQTPDQDLPH